jgi:hypothetical protein
MPLAGARVLLDRSKRYATLPARRLAEAGKPWARIVADPGSCRPVTAPIHW